MSVRLDRAGTTFAERYFQPDSPAVAMAF
jgi:hypothetical protein